MIGERTGRRSSTRLDAVLWWALLLTIFACSFLTSGYSSQSWLVFSATLYLLLACTLLNIGLGGRFNRRAVQAARWVLLLLGVSLVWLWLQLNLSLSHALYDIFKNVEAIGGDVPRWFEANELWSVSPSRGRWLLLSEMMLLGLFIAVCLLLDSRRRLKQLLIVLSLVAAVHASIGLFGKFAGLLFVEAKQVDGHFSAARGIFINRNHFSAFISISMTGLLAFQIQRLLFFGHAASSTNIGSTNIGSTNTVREHLSVSAMITLALLALCLLAMVGSESRGAFIAFFSAVVIALSYGGLKQSTISIKWLLTIAAASGIFSLYLIGDELIARLVGGGLSLGERSVQWAITLEAIKQNPIFGYGGGSYMTVFQIFRDDDTLRQVIFAQSHNHYLHMWVERGLIGLGFWVCILILSIRHLLQRQKKTSSRLIKGALSALQIGIFAALIQSVVDFNLQMINIRAYFMVLLAMAFAAPYIKHR